MLKIPLYYFDIETTGVEADINMILTIQYARLDDDFNPISELVIRKVWEVGSEKKMLQNFLLGSRFFDKPFSFIPVGNNLLFDIIFIYKRAKFYGLFSRSLPNILHEKPFIDIKPILVMLNNNDFMNYNQIIKKDIHVRNRDIPILYARKQYNEITAYIREEYEKTINILKRIREILMNNRNNLL